jgi:RecA/RadA recombinase
MYDIFLLSLYLQGEIGMQQIGLQARLMSQALRKMSGNASKAGCTLIFINQIRYKVLILFLGCSILLFKYSQLSLKYQHMT